jgi:hypothetical protein
MLLKENLFTQKSAWLLAVISVQFTMLYQLQNLFNIEQNLEICGFHIKGFVQKWILA